MNGVGDQSISAKKVIARQILPMRIYISGGGESALGVKTSLFQQILTKH